MNIRFISSNLYTIIVKYFLTKSVSLFYHMEIYRKIAFLILHQQNNVKILKSTKTYKKNVLISGNIKQICKLLRMF